MRRAILAVSAAIALALPAQARSKSTTVQCQDGTTSKSGRGACSHHGGIADSGTAAPPAKSKSKTRSKASDANASNAAQSNDAPRSKDTAAWNQGSEPGFFGRLMGRSAPAPRRNAPAQQGAPTARCNDGTTSYSQHHSGTCSGHGGVAQWLDQQ